MIYDKDNRPNGYEDDNELWDDELSLDDYHHGPDDSDDSDTFSFAEDREDSVETTTPTPDEDYDYYSEPEPKPEDAPATPKKSARERLFGRNDDDDEEGNDFYNSDAVEPVPVKKPKPPKLDPEDPDYWIEEESPLSRILPRTGSKWKLWLAVVLVLLTAILGVWIWFFRPYTDNAVKYGYIKQMERRGSIVKTFEGVLIPYKELGDPDPLYFEEVRFSVDGDSLATLMKRMMLNCVPVRLEYELYHHPILWKGEEPMIIVKADSADPHKILPPEYKK